MLSEDLKEQLYTNIFDEYNTSNNVFQNTLFDLEESKKIYINYEKFSNDESEPYDININLESIHIQRALINLGLEKELLNKLINLATEMIIDYTYHNKKKPSDFDDYKRYLVNIFTEKDINIKIKDEAIIYLATILSK
jgi:hypothetical protein